MPIESEFILPVVINSPLARGDPKLRNRLFNTEYVK